MTELAGLVHDIDTIDPLDLAGCGGKATGLARMTSLALPVPPAFVIGTAACSVYQGHDRSIPGSLTQAVRSAMQRLESATGKSFGGRSGVPLLVSVRSGAQISMPGMMDTVLNLGLDRDSVVRLGEATADDTFAVETWMRFWAMFADIVLDQDPELFKARVAEQQRATAGRLDAESAAALEQLVVDVLSEEADEVPIVANEQLQAAIRAVFDSWDSRRARLYRDHHGISHDLGTAVTVQAMVFGNLGAPAGSGVAFTRDPATGSRELYGEYLAGGQGEEVVAGTRTPVKLADAVTQWRPIVEQLRGYGDRLEAEYRDALDIEFTAEAGTLYLLQVRPAKRTAAAAVHIATELVQENVITATDALTRVTTDQVKHLIAPQFDAEALAQARAQGRVLTVGVPASPGHGSGQATLDADRAAQQAAAGHPVVLVRPTTSPQDLRGMLAASAVVTARGGATSHAAVVSRALDKPCVVGCEQIDVRPDEGVFIIAGRRYREGETISVNGQTGEIIAGDVPRAVPTQDLERLTQLLAWADDTSHVSVWPEAASSGAVEIARRTGASGIAIVNLTDRLQASTGLPVLLDAIGRYSTDPDAPDADVEQPVARAVHAAMLSILQDAKGLPIHVRVPNLTSARARAWVADWTSIAPHLLLPLGSRRLITAYAQRVRDAARDADHDEVTLLIGGVTSARELELFGELVGPDLGTGAVLQNPAVLAHVAALAATGRTLWVDLAELVRTTLGQPEELLHNENPSTDSETGSLSAPPPLLVERLLTDLVAAARPGTLGVRMTSAAVDSAAAMYDLGMRRFSSAVPHVEELRLVFAQQALKGQQHD